MNLDYLQASYFEKKQVNPEGVNDLLDFAKHLYISNVIHVTEYKLILKSLYELGAVSPDEHPYIVCKSD